MADREQLERLLAELKRQREEAEADATKAAEDLVRLASGLTPLEQCDPERVRAAADDFAGAIQRLQLLSQFARSLRALLM